MKNDLTYTKVGHNTIVNAIVEAPEEKKKILNRFKNLTEQVKGLETNVPIFETSIIEDYLKISPQPIWKGYKFQEAININDHHLKVEDVMDKRVPITGVHEKEGIAIFTGPDIKKGYKFNDVYVYDVAPTILALNNLPVAEDMDGKVITEAITDSFFNYNPIKHVKSYGEPDDVTFSEQEKDIIEASEELIRSRLKGLGYVD